jgi:hypothetical protein
MKRFIITEQQNDRIKQIIKQAAETFTNDYVVKTEVVVEDAKDYEDETYYVLHPIFYVTERTAGPDFHLFKHQLAQFVEDMVGAPVHSATASIRNVKHELRNNRK